MKSRHIEKAPEPVAVNRKPVGSGRPSKEELSVRAKFSGTENPEQIFMYQGKPVSAVAVAALRLAMQDGFLYRVVMSEAEARGGAREMRAR